MEFIRGRFRIVDTATSATGWTVQGSNPGKEKYFFFLSKTYIQAVGPSQSRIQYGAGDLRISGALSYLPSICLNDINKDKLSFIRFLCESTQFNIYANIKLFPFQISPVLKIFNREGRCSLSRTRSVKSRVKII